MSFIQKLKKYFYTKFNKEYKALYEQANEFHKSGNYKEAIRLYDKMISLYPNENEPYLGKGSILSMWGKSRKPFKSIKNL
ncbi:tetratricopeptide repeat protein [Rickettsia hoogstraalii]|uniref:tetratricopeptide repeat protein n=1 Tax=Rickettsia hoogstraalii TaxID=467174 RepID=UPI00058DF7F3|nr:tetratricopeptide repeat protein [Rickettsia hoogstraalii]